MIFVHTFELTRMPGCIRYTYDWYCLGKDHSAPLECYETAEYFKQLEVRGLTYASNTNT